MYTCTKTDMGQNKVRNGKSMYSIISDSNSLHVGVKFSDLPFVIVSTESQTVDTMDYAWVCSHLSVSRFSRYPYRA